MDPGPKIFGVVALALGLVFVLAEAEPRLPGNHQGYEPEQPLAFSHRLHAGELAMDCLYCHYGAARSRHAGIPATSVCMNCHKVVTAGRDAILEEEALAAAESRPARPIVSPELGKLYAALGLDPDLARNADREPATIPWVRVHQLPDFVWFDHSVHVARKVACESCHGPVQSMERVRQESSLSMGWCVACHRSTPADVTRPAAPDTTLAEGEHVTTDCAACHF